MLVEKEMQKYFDQGNWTLLLLVGLLMEIEKLMEGEVTGMEPGQEKVDQIHDYEYLVYFAVVSEEMHYLGQHSLGKVKKKQN